MQKLQKQVRGHGGFYSFELERAESAHCRLNVWAIKTYGRIVWGFTYSGNVDGFLRAAGTRYLSLLGGTCLSYDWYCDLPPASPMTLGRAD